jgi:hypothetical protein
MKPRAPSDEEPEIEAPAEVFSLAAFALWAPVVASLPMELSGCSHHSQL